MIGAKVNVVGGWGADFARKVNRQIPAMVHAASEDGAEVASRASSSRRRTGQMAQMETLPVRGTATGYQGGFRSKAWYAGFQSRGTKRGITPLGFLEKGRAAGRKSLKDRLNRL